MSNLLEQMKEFKQANPQHRYCNGYVSISFRTDTPEYDINKYNFILDGKKDGWFRIDSPSTGFYKATNDGWGICINEIKITSRKPVLVGDFICHKAKINYTGNEWESPVKEDFFWVFVHKHFDIKDVLAYIEENKENWYP